MFHLSSPKLSNIFLELGKKCTFLELARLLTISSHASIFLNSINPVPHLVNASCSNLAESASPDALIIAAFFSCIAFSTVYFALSASCWAICFFSTASVNSRVNPMWVFWKIFLKAFYFKEFDKWLFQEKF